MGKNTQREHLTLDEILREEVIRETELQAAALHGHPEQRARGQKRRAHVRDGLRETRLKDALTKVDRWASEHGLPLPEDRRHQIARLIVKCVSREEPKPHSYKPGLESIQVHARALLRYQFRTRAGAPMRRDSIPTRCDRLRELLRSTPGIIGILTENRVNGVALIECLERRDIAAAAPALRQLLKLSAEYGRGKGPLDYPIRLIRAVEAAALGANFPKPTWNGRANGGAGTLNGPLADAIRGLLREARRHIGDRAIRDAFLQILSN